MTDFLITAPLHTRQIARHRSDQMPGGLASWCAFRETEEPSRMGWGTTEADAIANLLELERR